MLLDTVEKRKPPSVTKLFGPFRKVYLFLQNILILSSPPDRKKKIEEIVDNVLLPAVVEHCRTKISAILKEPYSTPFRTWYRNTDISPFVNDVNANSRILLRPVFNNINTCLVTPIGQRTDDLVQNTVVSAHGVFDHNFHLIFEPQWLE
jgi:hypothetical protein